MLITTYRISSYSFLPWIVSSLRNYSSFYYIRENLMRKLFEIFKASIWGNTVSNVWFSEFRSSILYCYTTTKFAESDVILNHNLIMQPYYCSRNIQTEIGKLLQMGKTSIFFQALSKNKKKYLIACVAISLAYTYITRNQALQAWF